MDGVEPEFGRGLEAARDSTAALGCWFFSSFGSGACRKGPEIKHTHGLHLPGHAWWKAGGWAGGGSLVPACCLAPERGEG